MSQCIIYNSNRIEWLTEQLAINLSNPWLPPFIREVIVIPGYGMQRYISSVLTNHWKICANIYYPFPDSFIHYIYNEFLLEKNKSIIWEPENLSWKIAEVLPEFLKSKEFYQIAEYCSNDIYGIKLFQLSQKIADLFDSYTFFRPDMITSWENNSKSNEYSENQWQPILWRKIKESTPDNHRIDLRKRMFEQLDKKICIDKLPRRITLFGLAHLPVYYIEILNALSQVIPVSIYTLNPSRQFWDDIVSEKEIAKKTLYLSKKQQVIESQHFETGNPLLSSYGNYGKDFFVLLRSLEYEDKEQFFDTSRTTLLSKIQSDILNLSVPDQSEYICDTDRSIQIHICHNAMREIEVLYDNILSIFESDHKITPDDIVVMSPDIKKYIPYIETVFSTPNLRQTPQIPYTILNSEPIGSSPVIKDFFNILELENHRYTVSSVIAVLESKLLRNKFGFTEEDIVIIVSWIKAVNVHWGIDKGFKKDIDLPAESENTWKDGLNKLFLGYAMSEDNFSLFNDINPVELINENNAELFGKFAHCLAMLFIYSRRCNTEKTLSQWSELFSEMLQALFLEADITNSSLALLQKAVTNLEATGKMVNYKNKVSLQVIRLYLETLFMKNETGRIASGGGIIFSNLLQMRAIPFKVVCLIGMDHDVFPRKDQDKRFDIIKQHPFIGDRSLKNEDRYLFLESLLSARNIFYVSYIGFTVRDNSPVAPSIVLNELLEYSEKYYKGEHALLESITTIHKLNAFSKEYFTKGRDNKNKLFSYSPCNAEAARTNINKVTPFIQHPLQLPLESDNKNVTITQLCKFFFNPAEYFLRHKLGILPAGTGSAFKDNESFSIGGLEKYLIEELCIEQIINAVPENIQYLKAKSTGLLPHGNAGRCAFNTLYKEANRFSSVLSAIKSAPLKDPYCDISANISDYFITGRLSMLTEQYMIHYRSARIKPKDRLRMWIHHLISRNVQYLQLPEKSLLLGRTMEKKIYCLRYNTKSDTLKNVIKLLSLYTEAQIRPLSFYPRTSFAFAEAIFKGKSMEYAIQQAVNAWKGNYNESGESNDPYYRIHPGLFFSVNDEFIEIAMNIYIPMLEHEEVMDL